MASSPITSWQTDGETMETVTDFIFLDSKITADGDYSHEIKRRSLPGRQVMTNIDSILKRRDIALTTKVRLVKAMVFPVVVYGYESWTIKKAERRRIDAFEVWCWRRLLRVPWTARRSNQSILKEISPEYSLEGLMLNLKLQYSGHLMQRTDSLENTQKDACVLSCFRHVQLCEPMDCRPPGFSVEFSRQGYWTGFPFPFPPPGDLPEPEIKPTSPAWAGRLFTISTTWKAKKIGPIIIPFYR